MIRHKKPLFFVVAVLILVALPLLYIYREAQRARLNRMLIDAIVAEKYDYAIRLLQRGADGTARAGANESIQHVLSQIADRVIHRSSPIPDFRPSALQILYMGCPHPEWPSTERLATALLDSGSPTIPNSSDWQSFLEIAVSYRHHAFIRRLLTINPALAVGDGQALFYADLTEYSTIDR